MNHFGGGAEIDYRQRNDHGYLERAVPQHGLPPADFSNDTLEQRWPHRAGEVASARDQRQGRSAPSVEPAADINVHGCVDAADPDHTDEEPVPDPQGPWRPQRRDREAKPDHQCTAYDRPSRADFVS